MTAIRQCATGKRCFSGHYAQANPGMDLRKCAECGYWHTPTKPDTTSTGTDICQCGIVLATASDIAADLGENKLEPCRFGKFHHAADLHQPKAFEWVPVQNVELAELAIDVDGTYLPALGKLVDGDVVFVEFVTPDGTYMERSIGFNTPVRCQPLTARQRRAISDYRKFRSPDLQSEKNDAQLAQAVREVTARHKKSEDIKTHGDLFDVMAFDWMAGAISMLKQGEWAEAHPQNPMLADLEAQISELVGGANRFEEVKHKFAAACSTLESLGYTYAVEGAEKWRPPHGNTPDFIQWERGNGEEMPPAGAQAFMAYRQMSTLAKVTVMAIWKSHAIIQIHDDSDPEPEEATVRLSEVKFWPYSKEKHLQAVDIATGMVNESRRYSNEHLIAALYLIHSGKI